MSVTSAAINLSHILEFLVTVSILPLGGLKLGQVTNALQNVQEEISMRTCSQFTLLDPLGLAFTTVGLERLIHKTRTQNILSTITLESINSTYSYWC